MTDADPSTSASVGVRARARAELVAEITRSARNQLADHGAAALSLRAVSRDLGMASSAIYRYFPSRDALLTALIIESYDALGDACERAHAAVDPTDLLGRWRSVAHAARSWALENPHEYALIYGSPVPGYAAPDDTIDPATRVPILLLALLDDISATGSRAPETGGAVSAGLSAQLATMRSQVGGRADDALMLAGVGAWTELFGMLNFELFGQFANVFDDADDLFAHQVDAAAHRLGLRADGET
ncbi:MAG: TetR/AcrR family transcriptional regulator [Acidimicrobiales bacterium]